MQMHMKAFLLDVTVYRTYLLLLCFLDCLTFDCLHILVLDAGTEIVPREGCEDGRKPVDEDMLSQTVASTPTHQHRGQGGVVHGPRHVHPHQDHQEDQEPRQHPPQGHVGVVVGQGLVGEDVQPGDGDQDQGAQVLRHHGQDQGGGAPGDVAQFGGDLGSSSFVMDGQLQHPQIRHEPEEE